MVKGRAGPKSTSLLPDTPACRRTSAGSIATSVCSGLKAGRGPGTVGASALILLAAPFVLHGGAPEERLEASDLEAQEV